VTLRLLVEKLLTSRPGRYFEICSATASLFAVVVYIASTYTGGISWMVSIDLAVMIMYLIEYLLRLFASQHRLVYIVSVWSIVEFATILPLFLISEEGTVPYLTKLLNISRILRFLRVVKVINKYYQIGDNEYSGVSRQIYIITLTVFTLIIVTSGVLYAFEAPKRLEMIALDVNRNCYYLA
jgi:hypothetical protein